MLLHYLIFLFITSQVDCLYLEGRLHTSKDWAFLGRFCFLSDIGRLQFKFTYPVDYCCQNLLLYFDDGGQWSSVYKNASKSCFQKEAVLERKQNQIINLTTSYSWSGCVISNETSVKSFNCEGGRSFRSLHERWWYIAVSNCKSGVNDKGIDLSYEMKLTNGHSFWSKHFSADECGILETNIIFLVVFTGMFFLSIQVAAYLNERQLLHTTYKMFMICLTMEVFGLLLLCIALGTYASNGIENKSLKIMGESLESSAELLFLLLLLLLGKGFTVTRGHLTYSGTIKMSVFITIYAVIDIVLFLYEYVLFDPGLVLYVYESAAGYGWIALRLTAWVWFTHAVICTLKRYPEKNGFYFPLYAVYTIWFYAVPIMALVAAFAIPRYMRAKVVNGIEKCIDFMAYSVFLTLMRPQAANKNFPYHVRTSQISAITHIEKESTLSFPHSMYAETSVDNLTKRPAVFDLFTVNANVSQNTLTCTMTNRTSHRQIAEQISPVAPPYSEAFAAQKQSYNSNEDTQWHLPLDIPDYHTATSAP